MESLNTLKNVATKAIWGTDETTNNQEPISGKTGDVSKGQPYDAGNMEPEEQPALETPQPATTTKEPFSSSSHPSTPGLSVPHKTLSSSAAPGDHTKAQIDTRHPSDPNADHHSSAPKHDVDDGSGGLDVGANPDKQLDGPGPRPLEVVAKENDGDAGRSGRSLDKQAPRNEGNPGGAPLERKDSGKDTGTGELHVKSSGLKADGGDFDAAAPGAGREADRLLEQKGVHRDARANGGIVPNKGVDMEAVDQLNASGMAGSSGKEKVSLKTKIKAKLHLGSHSGTTA